MTNCTEYCCCGRSILVLEPEEVEFTKTDLLSQSRKRLPYGELGDVDHGTCCCYHSFNSAIGTVVEGEIQPISPGCGCSGELVGEIVEQLKACMKARGDTGNILRAEQSLKIMAHVSVKMDALLSHWRLSGAAEVPSQGLLPLGKKEYDVTGCCQQFCCCGSQILLLDPEEAKYVSTNCCTSTVSSRPYGQLSSVEESKCCCCVGVTSSMGAMQPKCGCETELVREVVEELKRRMRARGDTGNIQRQEELNSLLLVHDAQLRGICQKMGLEVPVVEAPQPMQMAPQTLLC